MILLLLVALLAAAPAGPAPDPFAPLALYHGTWTVRAEHPWSGRAPGAADRLVSRCQRFTRYFACEQTVNGRTQALLVYTADSAAGRLHARVIAPDGRAGGRGDLTIDGSRWTYLDRPPAGLRGKWSRVENLIIDRDHIRFEEYESPDEGRTWTRTNAGTEERTGA